MRVAEQLPPALCRGVLKLEECERRRPATATEHGSALACVSREPCCGAQANL
jgi:hypothetical protein